MKYAFIQRHRRVWPISVQCRVLQVSVAGYREHFMRRASNVQRRHLSDDALRMAWFKRHAAKDTGRLFHSDRGSQYASKDFRDVLAEYGITASMSRRQAKDEVMAWMLWYNRTRLHSTLAYVSPMQFEENWLAGQARQASA